MFEDHLQVGYSCIVCGLVVQHFVTNQFHSKKFICRMNPSLISIILLLRFNYD